MKCLLVLGISALTTLLLTRLIEAFAPRLHLTDSSGERKIHQGERPVGGAAIFFGVMLATAPLLPISKGRLGLLLGGLVVVTIGLIDDIHGLSPKLKLIGQAIAASIPIFFGSITISSISLVSFDLRLGLWGPLITMLWIVGVTNALNLIDGLDGLAAGGTAIVALFTTFFAWRAENSEVIWLSLALLGTSLSFLRYNFYPARVFMGDGGSYFLGFLLSILTVEAMQGDFGIVRDLPFFVPITLLGLPIADTLWAIMRRAMARRSILAADRGHIHHRLLERGWGYRRTVGALYGVFAIMGLLGLVLYYRG